MSDIKISASFLVPGAKRYGEAVCEKDRSKYEHVEVKASDGKTTDRLHLLLRKRIPAKQVINISREAYEYMVGSECPSFSTPTLWKGLGRKAKIQAHLEAMAKSLGGKLDDYTVYYG